HCDACHILCFQTPVKTSFTAETQRSQRKKGSQGTTPAYLCVLSALCGSRFFITTTALVACASHQAGLSISGSENPDGKRASHSSPAFCFYHHLPLSVSTADHGAGAPDRRVEDHGVAHQQ